MQGFARKAACRVGTAHPAPVLRAFRRAVEKDVSQYKHEAPASEAETHLLTLRAGMFLLVDPPKKRDAYGIARYSGRKPSSHCCAKIEN